MKRYILIIILVIIIFFLSRSLHRQRQENDRLSSNQTALFQDISYYRTRDSLSAASVERLTLTKKELEQNCEALARDIKDLKIKLKRVQSVSQASIETEHIIRTVVRDSLIVRDRVDTLQCIDYHDNYLTLSGCIEHNHFSGHIMSRDTLLQVIHRVPHRWWFIKWGTKAVRQEIVSKNPHTHVVYSRYIELKR
ncbi:MULTISPECIES: DUF6549 family protein [Bacteroidales]|uniref:DUF6549 family protein n=1 Tax=Bacteroidales TaxID=171549 RepID=UPI000335053E|nr:MULTISPECIES: DUF6549 family protein [Bacteroidales]CCY36800.1 putative uncharacterized protein [Tannerella sp. CAG:118]